MCFDQKKREKPPPVVFENMSERAAKRQARSPWMQPAFSWIVHAAAFLNVAEVALFAICQRSMSATLRPMLDAMRNDIERVWWSSDLPVTWMSKKFIDFTTFQPVTNTKIPHDLTRKAVAVHNFISGASLRFPRDIEVYDQIIRPAVAGLWELPNNIIRHGTNITLRAQLLVRDAMRKVLRETLGRDGSVLNVDRMLDRFMVIYVWSDWTVLKDAFLIDPHATRMLLGSKFWGFFNPQPFAPVCQFHELYERSVKDVLRVVLGSSCRFPDEDRFSCALLLADAVVTTYEWARKSFGSFACDFGLSADDCFYVCKQQFKLPYLP